MATKTFCDLCGLEFPRTPRIMKVSNKTLDTCLSCEIKVVNYISINTIYLFKDVSKERHCENETRLRQ